MKTKFEKRGSLPGVAFTGFIKIDDQPVALYLTPSEINIMQVALTHLEEHLNEISDDFMGDELGLAINNDRLDETKELLRYLTPEGNENR